tara:strand:+ start:89 stop:211 length:123 start_codon:yes stop_codon:yes gene_type:complete
MSTRVINSKRGTSVKKTMASRSRIAKTIDRDKKEKPNGKS